MRVYRWLPVDPEGEYSHPMLKFTGKPIPNGYCMVGEVVEIGSDVTDFSIGDVVYMGEPHQEYGSSVADNIATLGLSFPILFEKLITFYSICIFVLTFGITFKAPSVIINGLSSLSNVICHI